jgi:predicted SAM-dependent methyltransferase
MGKKKKLYLGSRDYRPPGFLTVDIDAAMKPDIIADLRDLSGIGDKSCDEIIASAVLEHIDWPDGFLACAEFARVLDVGGRLQVSVPDMAILARMMLSGDSSYYTVGMIYGVGGRTNKFEQHRYGYTCGMLVEILETLGFGKFNWWHSELPDAANGWLPRIEDHHTAVPINLAAIKTRDPLVSARDVYKALCDNPLGDFLGIAAQFADANISKLADDSEVARLYQLIHYRLIEARQRVKYLENKISEMEGQRQ